MAKTSISARAEEFKETGVERSEIEPRLGGWRQPWPHGVGSGSGLMNLEEVLAERKQIEPSESYRTKSRLLPSLLLCAKIWSLNTDEQSLAGDRMYL